MNFEIFALLIMFFNIIALLHIYWSHSKTTQKIIWSIVVVSFPIVGLVAWFVFGPKDTANFLDLTHHT